MRDAEASTPRRPRPVSGAPVGPFALGTGLAKAWLLELLATLPLHEAGRIPAATLAREAPALCAAVCAALVRDEDLDRLGPAGADHALASRAAAMTGATDAAGAATAIDTLRRVIWEALSQELRRPDGREVAELSERLAHVTAVLLQAALGHEEHDLDAAPGPPVGVVSLRDVRGAREEAPSWRAALERRLERHARDAVPFALLLVELDDLPVLLSAHEADELAAAIHTLERAVGTVLRPGDVLVREDPGRYWITLSDTDAEAAREVATDIASTVAAGVVLHGSGLTVSVGVSVCPDDGTLLAPLAEQAEEGLYLARASGLPVTS